MTTSTKSSRGTFKVNGRKIITHQLFGVAPDGCRCHFSVDQVDGEMEKQVRRYCPSETFCAVHATKNESHSLASAALARARWIGAMMLDFGRGPKSSARLCEAARRLFLFAAPLETCTSCSKLCPDARVRNFTQLPMALCDDCAHEQRRKLDR